MSDLIERSARILAAQGPEAIANIEAIANRAKAMLAAGEVEPSPVGPPPPPEPFWWQVEQVDAAAPREIWMAAVEDSATGEGITGYFLAGLFRSEAEVRRQLAGEVGVWLADIARVGSPAEPLPSAKFFATERLISSLQAMSKEQCGPGLAAFFVRFQVNFE